VTLFPLATFDAIEDAVADAALVTWGHWLEGCARPFGRQSFGLFVSTELIAVAVSASTAGASAGGWSRFAVVELVRLCARPDQRWATRVALRLWREIAPRCWAKYWPVEAVVSYQNAVRHTGNIYRFDGWTMVGEVPGSTGGGTYSAKKPAERKAVWVYVLGDFSDADRRARALERAA
jgi:hypothetical protein